MQPGPLFILLPCVVVLGSLCLTLESVTSYESPGCADPSRESARAS